MVYIKTYLFNHFYQQYLVLLTTVPRNSTNSKRIETKQKKSAWGHRTRVEGVCILHGKAKLRRTPIDRVVGEARGGEKQCVGPKRGWRSIVAWSEQTEPETETERKPKTRKDRSTVHLSNKGKEPTFNEVETKKKR